MGAFIMQVVGLILLLTINVLFFSKKKINTDETKIYSKLLLLGTVFVIVGIFVYVVAVKTNDLLKIALVQRLYLIIFILLNYYCIKYCICLFEKIKNNEIVKGSLLAVTSISIVLTILLPLQAIFEGEYLSGDGPAYYLCIGYTLMTGIIFIIVTIAFAIERRKFKKIIPFIVFVVVYIVGLLINEYYKDSIILEGFYFAYVFLIMYHTIENPDLKLLEEYNDNKELAELNMEDKSNLLFQISQEVSAPIRKIKILSKSILNSDNIDDIKNNISNIYDLTNGISNTVDEILDITSMDKNNIKLYDGSYNIYNLFSQVVYLVKNKIDNDIDFKYSINSFIPETLHGDSIKLKQIMCSILMNCASHVDKGVIDLDISAIVKNDICRLIITITDNGEGMALQKINKVISTIDKENEDNNIETEDYNIDLKAIKKIVNLLGGNLLIKSYENEGTVFTVVLDQLFETTTKDEMFKEMESLSNKQKVLVVDDDYKELELIAKELKRNNYNVLSTMYGKDVVDRLNNNEKYDLIFVDDELEGYSAVKMIGELTEEQIEKTKIIIMLSENKEKIKDNYLKDYPFTDYFIKSNYQNEIKRIKDKF